MNSHPQFGHLDDHQLRQQHGTYALGIEILAARSDAFRDSLPEAEPWRLHLAYAGIELARARLLAEPDHLGDELVFASVRTLSEAIFGEPLPGLRRALDRIGPFPMREGRYRLLGAALACPLRRKRVFHAPQVSSGLLELLDILPDAAISSAVLGWDHGDPEVISNVRHAVSAIASALDPVRATAAWRALACVDEPRELSTWFFDHLTDIDLPSPPWEGTSSVRPIRTHGELRQTAKNFRNCLWDRLSDFSSGIAFAYLCREPALEAVAVIYADSYRRWQLSEIRGVANRTLSPEALDYLVACFGRAGISYAPYRRAPWVP